MAATDARPVAIKNTAFRVYFDLRLNTGALNPGATGLDSEVSKDGGTMTDCTNEATEIATSSGHYFLDLTSTEMNADSVVVQVKSTTTNAVTRSIMIYPQESGDIKVDVQSISGDVTAADNLETAYDDTAGPVPWHDVIDQGTAQSGSTSTTLVLRAALSLGDDIINGAAVRIVSGTGAGQTRLVDDFVGSTDTVTVSPAWTTTPDNTSVYRLLACPPASTNSLPQVDVYKIEGVDATDQLDAHAAAGLDAAGVRAAVGLTSANLDTQLSTIDSTADAILADTADMQPKLGTPAADISADIAAVKVDTAATLVDTAEIGAAGAGLTALATQASVDTIDGIVDDLKSGIIYGAAATGTLSTTQATTDLTGYADDQLIGRVIIWLSGACDGEASDISDYASASGLLTFTALTTAPGNGDTFKLV